MSTIAILFVFSIIALYALPRGRDFFDECDFLIAKLPKNQLGPIVRFIDEPKCTPAEFREATGQERGIAERLTCMTIYIRIIERHYKERKITKSDAREVWSMVVGQTWFSFWAILETMLGRVIPSLSPIAAKEAARYFCKVVYRTDTLCSVDGAPECIKNLDDLL